MNVAIVLGRCEKSKALYGMRFEQRGRSTWVATWAFRIKEGAARREGFDKTRLKGELTFGPEYPGCPYCEAPSIAQCRCDKITCWRRSSTTTCAWCGTTAPIEGVVDDLGGGGDA